MKNLLHLIVILPLSVFSQAVFQRKVHINDSIYYSKTTSWEKPNGHFLNMTSFSTLAGNSSQLHLIETDSTGAVAQYRRYSVPTNQASYTNMDVTPGGQLAVAGHYYFDQMLMTFDNSNNLLAVTTYDFGYTSNFRDILHTPQQHYRIGGYRNNPSRAVLLEADMSGNLSHCNEYQVGTDQTSFLDLILLTDGSTLASGIFSTGTTTYVPALFVKIDPLGDVVWSLHAGQLLLSTYPVSSVELADGSIIASGNCSDPGPPYDSYIFILKISANGQLLWSKKYDSPDALFLVEAQLDNNELVFCGYNTTSLTQSTFLFRTDTAGTMLSCVLYSDPIWNLAGAGLVRCSDGGFFTTAMMPVGNGFLDHYFLKTDNSLSALCAMSPYSLTLSNFPMTSSTGIYQYTSIPVVTTIPNSVFADATLIPFESDACTGAGLQEPEGIYDIAIYSAENYFELTFSSSSPELIACAVYDMTGKRISGKMINATSGINREQIKLNDLADGLYMVTLHNMSGNFSVKVLKER